MWQRLVQLGFRLLYNEFAWTYDFVSWIVSLGEWRKWQYAALAFVAGERVLELAHGTGHLLPRLHERGFTTVGMDLSPAMGRIASGRLRRLGIRIPLLQGSAMALPYANDSFDCIVTTFPTNFVVDERALAEFGRILPPNGRLVIVPSGSLRANGPIERLISLAFAITGQAADSDVDHPIFEEWVAHFGRNNLNLTIHTVDYPLSQAIVLVATQSCTIW